MQLMALHHQKLHPRSSYKPTKTNPISFQLEISVWHEIDVLCSKALCLYETTYEVFCHIQLLLHSGRLGTAQNREINLEPEELRPIESRREKDPPLLHSNELSDAQAFVV
jgi:hypothetical protein